MTRWVAYLVPPDADGGQAASTYTNHVVLQQVSGAKVSEAIRIRRASQVDFRLRNVIDSVKCRSMRTDDCADGISDDLHVRCPWPYVGGSSECAEKRHATDAQLCARLARSLNFGNPASGPTSYIYDSYPAGTCGGWTRIRGLAQISNLTPVDVAPN